FNFLIEKGVAYFPATPFQFTIFRKPWSGLSQYTKLPNDSFTAKVYTQIINTVRQTAGFRISYHIGTRYQGVPVLSDSFTIAINDMYRCPCGMIQIKRHLELACNRVREQDNVLKILLIATHRCNSTIPQLSIAENRFEPVMYHRSIDAFQIIKGFVMFRFINGA